MNRLFLIVFTVFVSVMLLSQVVATAEGKSSDARKKAKAREDSLIAKAESAAIAKLQKQKKDLDPKTSTPSTTSSTNAIKVSIDTQNAAYSKALNDARTNLDKAKKDLNLANRALLRDSSNSAKIQAVAAAEIVMKKAEIDLKIVLLNKK